jgi:hypothetical protein
MKYYKKIDIDFYDEIIQDTLAYLKNQRPDVFDSPVKYNVLNIEEFKRYCPKLDLGFARYNLTCNFASAVVSHKTSDIPIHVDTFKGGSRINLPILNTKNTFTRFYSGGEFTYFINPVTGVSYSKISRIDNLKLVDKVEIDQATVMRIHEPHDVKLLNSKIPRITLTLGFDKDPVFLLED